MKMKINFLVSIVCALLLGYLCANFIFSEYKENKTVYGESNTIYFLQYGVYKNKDHEKINASKYLEVKEDDKYYIYIGMTTSLENAEKIKNTYKEKGIEIYNCVFAILFF